MTREEALAQLRVRLYEQLEIEPDDITEDALLVDELGVDSLDFLELIVRIKSDFGISIRDGEVKQLLRSLALFLPGSNAAAEIDDAGLKEVTHSLRISTLLDFIESRMVATAR